MFADELFRFNLAFRIRDAGRAEPSEWEIAGRYISWAVLPVVLALAALVPLLCLHFVTRGTIQERLCREE